MPSDSDYRAFRFFNAHAEFLFLDVGANVGQTIDAVRMHGWHCRIIAFEPNSNLARKLERTYARNEPLIDVRNEALSDFAGTADLFVPYYRDLAFDGLASLDRNTALAWLSPERLFLFDENKLSCRQLEVSIRTLDSLGLEPDFIKLDVQGAELAVLRGGTDTIERRLPGFLIEAPRKHDEIAYLQKLGYEHYAFDGTRFLKDRLGTVNTFFFTDDFLDRMALPVG